MWPGFPTGVLQMGVNIGGPEHRGARPNAESLSFDRTNASSWASANLSPKRVRSASMRLVTVAILVPSRVTPNPSPSLVSRSPEAASRKERSHADQRNRGQLRAGRSYFRLVDLCELPMQSNAELIAERVHHDEGYSAPTLLKHRFYDSVEDVGVRQAAMRRPSGDLKVLNEERLDLLQRA